MSKENEISFEEPKFYLEFTIYDYNENNTSVFLEVGCGEDIENYMKDYFKENWEEMFCNKVPSINDISYVTIDGISIEAKDGNCEIKSRIPSRGSWQYNFAKIKFNIQNLEDKNALKIKQIRELIGN